MPALFIPHRSNYHIYALYFAHLNQIMYAQSFVAFLALANTALGFPHAARSTGSKAELFAQLEALTKTASEKTLEDIRSGDSSRTSASCTPETVKVRKEWYGVYIY